MRAIVFLLLLVGLFAMMKLHKPETSTHQAPLSISKLAR